MTTPPAKSDPNARTRAIRWTITICAIVIGIAHLLWPSLTIDAITLALIVIAVSPWLGTVFKAIELPGGLKIEYHDLEKAVEKARDAGLLSPREGIGGGRPEYSFQYVGEFDPNLALAGLRIEIEKRLNVIAQANGLISKGGIGRLLEELDSRGILSPKETSALRDMAGLLNSAVHGAKVDPSAAAWALDVSPALLRVLDERAERPG